MRWLNCVELIGEVVDVPSIFTTAGGELGCSLRLALYDSWKEEDFAVGEEHQWLSVVAWGKLAEICDLYVKKGMMVYAEGRLANRIVSETREVDPYLVDIVVEDLILLNQLQHVDPDTNEVNHPSERGEHSLNYAKTSAPLAPDAKSLWKIRQEHS